MSKAKRKLNEGEETFVFGQYHFDVHRALELIGTIDDVDQIEVVSFPMDSIRSLLGLMGVNHDHVNVVDEAKPGIAVLMESGALPIDGWHRATKRIQAGLEVMDFYLIKDPALVKEITLNSPRSKKARL